jgi:hypothetical protein
LLVGLFFRVRPIHESLWVDELHTAWTVSEHFSDVAHRSHMGNQSPLYPWMMWVTTRTLGQSEPAFRLPSLLAGMSLIVAGGCVVMKWSKSGPLALLAALLIAVDPHSIFFAQEARAYALVQLCALLQVACFARVVLGDASRLSRFGWIGLTWMLFYLHYTSLLLMLGEVIFCVVATCFRWTRRDPHAWLFDLAIILAGLLPAAPHLREIAARRDNWSKFVVPPNWIDALTVFRFDAWLLVPSIVFVLLATIALLCGRRWGIKSAVAQRMVLMACWLLAPLAFAWLMTISGWLHLFFRRYLISVAVAPMVLAGLLGAALPDATNRRFFALLSAAIAAGLILPFHPIEVGGVRAWHGPENWRDAIASINDRPALTDLPVFVRSGLIEDDGLRDPDVNEELIDFCLLTVRSLYRLDRRTGVVEPLPGSRSWELSTQQSEELSAAGGAWFIVRAAPHDANTLGRYTQRWLSQRGINVTVQGENFGNVSVLLLQVRESSTSAPSGLVRALVSASCVPRHPSRSS